MKTTNNIYLLPFFGLILALTIQSCTTSNGSTSDHNSGGSDSTVIDSVTDPEVKIINPEGKTLNTRFNAPQGYSRPTYEDSSFAQYLSTLPLKTHGAQVKMYDGSIKYGTDVYNAVVDLKIGNKDLHQCADAVMRLRAEYLWIQKDFSKIHFNFTNGFKAEYSKWISGKRIKISGNNVYWTNGGTASNTHSNFWKYMERVFSYAGTYSLSKELKKVNVSDMHVGDIFIQGGFPGHAIIVADIAVSQDNQDTLFMLAQSYMPAQEIQILINPNDSKISPWYSKSFGETLYTPEWTFSKGDLKRFDEN
jgi:hypothetical protein